MIVAWSDQHCAGTNDGAVLSFGDGQGRNSVQTLGQQFSKDGRHVLNDEDRDIQIARQIGYDRGQSIGASCG